MLCCFMTAKDSVIDLMVFLLVMFIFVCYKEVQTLTGRGVCQSAYFTLLQLRKIQCFAVQTEDYAMI